MPRIQRTSFTHQRPAPRTAPGKPPRMNDIVNWTRIVDPREKYRIVYKDSNGSMTERNVELLKEGEAKGTRYYLVIHAGIPKTLRADRVVSVLEQLTQGHAPSIEAQPGYSSRLPAFPVAGAVYKVPTIASGRRTWTVDLNAYTCTCPESRRRAPQGYDPGTLGAVCPHMARAILDHLPKGADWAHGLLAFLRDPRKVAIENLS